MDKWNEDQLKRMRLGGNSSALEFFKSHPSWREKMTIPEKYNSEFARWYKDKLSADCEGRSWIRPNPSPAAPNQPQATQPPQLNSSSIVGNSSFRVNDAYFASKGLENENRPSNLPPSPVGKYAATQVAVSSAEVLGQTLSELVINALRDPNNSLSSTINAFGQVVTENGTKGTGFVKGVVVNAANAAAGENIGGFSGFSGFGDANDEWYDLLQKAESLKKDEATDVAISSQNTKGGFGGFDKFEEMRRKNASTPSSESHSPTSVSKAEVFGSFAGKSPDPVAKKSGWDTDDTWEEF
ncbi:hypothetical protein HDU82_005364 [Entophlyctis luteolus]|nr:hypothetical protein HDU82_005364 [Entophlyctis luteolus]